MPLLLPTVPKILKTEGFGLCPHAQLLSEGDSSEACDLFRFVLFLHVLLILKVELSPR